MMTVLNWAREGNESKRAMKARERERWEKATLGRRPNVSAAAVKVKKRKGQQSGLLKASVCSSQTASPTHAPSWLVLVGSLPSPTRRTTPENSKPGVIGHPTNFLALA